MIYLVIFLVLIGSSGMIVSQAFGAYVEFENGKDRIAISNDHVVDFKLDWGIGDSPAGKITFDEPVNDTILLQIPKSIPRTTNLDFGHFSLYALQTDGSEFQIKETESECFYILEIPVKDSDFVEIIGASVATGRWEPVSILNQSCGEFTLKHQIENKMSSLEIECKNEKHVLVERNNSTLACVYPSTAEKLGWNTVRTDSILMSSVFEVVNDMIIFDVEYSLSEGTIQDITYDADTNLILITMDASEKAILTITLPRDLIDAKMDYCPPQKENSRDDIFFVLVNEGVYDFGIGYKEILYKETLTTDESRTLQIHFSEDVSHVQIIGTCLI